MGAIASNAPHEKLRQGTDDLFRRGRSLFSAVEIDPNEVLRWVPRPVITGMIATEIPAAMRPYSIAVAPDSSAMNALSFRRIS
jgi:hypothetical protein